MLNEQHDVVVSDLMTTEVERVPAEATAATALEWFEERGYTAAPVADTSPTASVTAAAVADAAEETPDETLATLAEPVSLSRLLSPKLGFGGMLDALREEPIYFVGWDGEVVGVISRADLNKPPAHAHLYTLVYELEARLRDLIDERTDWEVILRNVGYDGDGHSTEYDKLRAEYEEYVDADLHLRPVDYTTFWQLERVVEEHDDLWTLLPFSSQDRAVRKLGAIRDLRNQVAHYGNVIHSMDADLLASGRDIIGLKETYSAIVDVNSALRDHQTGEPTASA
ncbi:hypothetical protein JCM30237_04850 [Halolamina litorea]|nr:CBS domain-containing protein [Halolamina litorea]